MVIGKVTGKFERFSGSYYLKNRKLTSFKAKCHTRSINTGNSKRDNDLKSRNFFHSVRFPKMTMKTVKIYKKTVLVELTIKGTVRKVTFVYHPKKRAKNNTCSGFILRGYISPMNFGLDLHKTVGAKSILLGDKVEIIANIEGTNCK
jgi:polyisoprenoid-binding protein YceI